MTSLAGQTPSPKVWSPDELTTYDGPLLLDTHVWLWHVEGEDHLAVDAAVWLQRAEQAPGIQFRPLTRPVLLQSTRLTGASRQDPVDRMLIASAQLDGIPLVTRRRARAPAHALTSRSGVLTLARAVRSE